MITLEKQLEEAQAKATLSYEKVDAVRTEVQKQIADALVPMLGFRPEVLLNSYSTTIRTGAKRNEISISHDRNYNFKTGQYDTGLKFELGWFSSRATVGADEYGYFQYLSALGIIAADLSGDSKLIPIITEARERLGQTESVYYDDRSEISRIERDIQAIVHSNERGQIKSLITDAISFKNGIIKLTQSDSYDDRYNNDSPSQFQDQVAKRQWVTFDGVTVTAHKKSGFFVVRYNEFSWTHEGQKQYYNTDFCKTIKKITMEDFITFINGYKKHLLIAA
jgi:hypothetical protein